MPNALNDRLIEIRNTVRSKGISAVTDEELTLMITCPVVRRDDCLDEEKEHAKNDG